MAQTPAKRTAKPAPKKKSSDEMFVPTSDIDDDGNYTALVFGEEFSLSTDVNGWALMMLGAGSLKAMRDLVESLVNVEPEEGESFEAARLREQERFHGTLMSQRHFTVEDAVTFVNKLTEFSGNDLPE